ncbi:MAG: PorV/PorQ family protein [Candidatus Krumholzibacteria bacterium]|nr:PorV/PorQ family protein [Candidatus Krumholzibacteria bacterium]
MIRLTTRTRIAAALGLVAVACLSTATLAQDDGGGRSILAEGAGNRALSLGGAYAGIADDASAVIWNPGGLGFVQRREFQATHTDLLGMGFNEQYASFVLPDWRWGVGSLTFRRFGVGGIEGRDERNVLTDTELSDAETELSFGYGREVGAYWSVGAALKLRNQSLAGYSDSGLGADVGLLVRPLAALGVTGSSAQNLSLGLAVRNLLEPSLRLNEEPVTDPLGFRVGSAYRWHFGNEGDVLLALDVEKTRDMNAHLHAGLELNIVRALALRVGLNRGRLTAGAGVSWRDIGIDYQFEDSRDDYIQRLGIAMKLGKTRDEAQGLALAEEELELRRQLDTVFADQQQRRMAEMVSKIKSALRDKDADEAWSQLAMAKVMDPEEPELASLEAQVLILQSAAHEAAGDYAAAMVALRKAGDLDPTDGRAAAMLERIRAANDAQNKRTNEIRGLLDGALDAFAAGDLMEAKSAFQHILTLAPADREAQSMLALTELAIATRVTDHLAQVRVLARASEFERARAELAAARALQPTHPGIAVAAKYIADQNAKGLTSGPASVPSVSESARDGAFVATPQDAVPDHSVQELREMAEFYGRGVAAMEAGEKEQAIHFWELVWSMDSDFKQVTESLSGAYLAKGMEFFVAGELPDAMASWEAAVRVNPEDPKALGYLQRAREQTKRMRMMDHQ